jgi:hypothetical protein
VVNGEAALPKFTDEGPEINDHTPDPEVGVLPVSDAVETLQRI